MTTEVATIKKPIPPLKQIVVHFRLRRQDGEKLVLKNYGGYSVVAQKSEARPGFYNVAWARCGKRDNFNRKLGQKIAENRLHCTHKAVSFEMDKGTVLNMLNSMNKKCNDVYKSEFFERLLARLV